MSLKVLIDHWRRVAEEPSTVQAEIASRILELLEQAPELKEPIADRAVLERHRDLLDLLMSAVFPAALGDQTYAAAFAPFDMEIAYATPGYKDPFRLRIAEPAPSFAAYLHNMDATKFVMGKVIKAYSLILRNLYDVDASFDYPVLFRAPGDEAGLERYFKLDFNARFVEIRPTGPLKPLTADEIQRLVAEPMNLPLWMELLPPDGFEFTGFVVMTLVDVTDHEVLSALKNDLLQKDAMSSPEKIDHLQGRVRTLLQRPDLQMGLVCVERNGPHADRVARAVGRSLFTASGEVVIGTDDAQSTLAAVLATACEPLVVNDLNTWPTPTQLERDLLAEGYRNVVIAPLLAEGKPIGLLELASPNVGSLTALSAIKLMQALPLFATALNRSLEEQDDRIQAVIKEHFTAIHPAVEWRFREAARAYIRQADSGSRRLEPIVFQDVYPLYGLTDIRGSSMERSAAIQADLADQLGLALAVVVEATSYRPMPILDVLGHRLMNSIAALESGLHTEDEITVVEFLQDEVEPLFSQLRAFGDGVRQRIATYESALDPVLGVLHRRRKAFEESVTLINESVSCYLEGQDKLAQSVFPHYFEKYKTDGVDHNIYVGASLLEDGQFDLLYLQNLRIWQLMLMCGVEWKLRSVKPRLQMPLETTHLILVHSAPLSIRFRYDEKRFDADGAYNIRYEITKKRIDKALIRGTEERLTQPGTISIVYQHSRDAAEYRRYLDYLRAAGYLTGTIEELELEDTQGAYGLKAFRVHVNQTAPEQVLRVGPEIIGELRERAIPAEVE